MKILLFITGFDQVIQYDYFRRFLEPLDINRMCDIYIYCNNPNISPDVFKYYQNFSQKNKYLHITPQNSGYRIGGVEALSNGISMGIFSNYDYVIHLHPDVFITDDNYLMNVLNNNIDNDNVFFITKSVPDDNTFFSFDFFIFKPKLLKTNIFIEDLYNFQGAPEVYLHDMIKKNDIKYSYIKRFDTDHYLPRRVDDNLKLYHSHDMSKAIEMLEQRHL
jgi:hypothetical protein